MNAHELNQRIDRIEDLVDDAKDVCGQAGQVDPQVKQAVMRAHEEASRLKHEIEADSPA